MARPKKADALDIKSRAVEHALQMIAARSSCDFTLAELAQVIGCSAPALYSHFSGKDALLKAIRQHGFDQVTQRKATHYADPTTTPTERLRLGGLAYLAFARSNPALYRLLYAPPAVIAAEASPIPERALAAFTSAIRTCQEAGFAPGRDPRGVALMLWSMVHGAAMLALDRQIPGDDAQAWVEAESTVETIIALLALPHKEPIPCE